MTAQWDDDVHHALHWLLTGETAGYYGDFGSCDAVAHALERGFLHDGRWSSFRGRTHGRPVDWTATDPWRMVVSLQTHDQVGNRAAGDRLVALVGIDLAACGAALLLTLPYTPMLFMGEEWGASTPWCFFSSFPDEGLSRAVTEGRRREFARHGWDAEAIPDPQDPATRDASVLRLDEQPNGRSRAACSSGTATSSPCASCRAARDRRRHGGESTADSDATAGDLHCRWSAGRRRPARVVRRQPTGLGDGRQPLRPGRWRCRSTGSRASTSPGGRVRPR